MQFTTCMLKGTEELKGAKILWKLKTCEVLHNLLNSEKLQKVNFKTHTTKILKSTIYWRAKKFQKSQFQ